jgi:type II secretory pathway component GspD/PulD (secretin)
LADRSSWVPISANALAPVVNSRLADTVVVVPDGQTVVIGGLMQTQILESESKIPLLGDIPYLGNAFKRKIKSNQKTELMIFLTPVVIAAPGQLAGITAEERGRTTLKPKMIPKTELDSLIDTLPVKPEAPVQPLSTDIEPPAKAPRKKPLR